MRIIARKTLRVFWERHPDAKDALAAWYQDASKATWGSCVDIIQEIPYVDCLPDNRVVFNIRGNHYRLIVKIHYDRGFIYIRFVGTHAEYNRIDALTV
jgi:mRNA interferase HigB